MIWWLSNFFKGIKINLCEFRGHNWGKTYTKTHTAHMSAYECPDTIETTKICRNCGMYNTILSEEGLR